MNRTHAPRFVALLGASAGGLEPLRELVAAMPHDPQLSCVVAQHIAATEPSALARLLQSVTSTPVETVRDGVELRGGVIYVTPSGHHVELDGRRLRLQASVPGQGPAPSLDRLFASAARSLGARALAIVLSGTGQDGAVGARVLRDAGGAVWAESPAEAPFASMPQTIIERGLADHVDTAVALGRRLRTLLQAADQPATPQAPSDSAMADERQAMAALVHRVATSTGLELGQYQEATLRRQFERVMRQHGATSLVQLAAEAERNPELLRALQQSVTIGVTEWLRNPSAFAALRVAWREHIRARAAAGAATLRLWSVGCSSGEEAYTLAMLTDELLGELGVSLDWMVLGTDVNAAALEQARSGLFDEDSASALPAAWRERYFSRIGHTLRLQQELRRRCIFTRHDVLQDLPFLRMDLVACRNVLIYLKGSAKDEVLRRLHHALLPDGLLMLGRSEALSARTRTLFTAVSTQEHLWRKRPDAHAPPLAMRARLPAAKATPVPPAPPQLRPVDHLEADLRERLLQHLLQRHAPPTVLLDRDGHPLHVVGSMDGLMRWPAGATVALTMPNLVDAAWRRDVQLAMHRLLDGSEASLRVPLPVAPGQPARVLEAARFDLGHDPYVVMSFVAKAVEALPSAAGASAPNPEQTLQQERLESLVDALERSQRQLQQLNEELSVTSEELEAANEELEASNEELEASNEELRTLNEELDRSLREQQQLNELLHAVQESAGTALLVLDHERRLLRFNQLAADLLGLRDTHLGTAWTFDARRFAWPAELVEHVARGLPGPWSGGIEQGATRHWLQLVPWRTHDERDGYVLALTDLTALRQAEQARLEMQRRLAALTDALHEAVVLMDALHGRIEYASRRLGEWLPPPQPPADASTLAWLLESIHPEEQGRVQARWHDERSDHWTQRYRLRTPDGGWRCVQERAARLPADEGAARPIAVSLLDVTELMALERREQVAHSRLQAVWDNPSVGMVVCSPDGAVLECNPALAQRLGCPAEDMRGTPWQQWIHPDDRDTLQQQWRAMLSGRQPAAQEQRLLARDGTLRWARQHVSLARHPAPLDDVVVVLLENIDEAKAREQTIFRQANYDALTGLPNRALYRDRLEQALLRAQRELRAVYVMFIDLDGFKEVNDIHGHELGDEVLVETAGRIRRALRANDTVARFGGDEFVVMLDAADSPLVVERVADNILQALRQPYTLHGNVLRLSASIGVAAYPSDGETSEELLRMADTAMYAAKNGGRDRMRFYSPQMESRARHLAEIKTGLEQALADSAFELLFQPVVSLPEQRVRGAEVLLRWRHPTRGLVSPVEFIAVAEASGQIRRIGAWVLRESARLALQAAQRWGPGFRLAVNVSGAQFGDSTLRDWLEEHRAALPHLTIEVTESVWMADSPSTLAWLQRVREGGGHVALDDFGTGYSSLAYLLRTPVDVLKVDKRFTDHVGTGGPSERIVTAVLELAAALQARVVVEGVETAAQLEFLTPRAPLDVQGFHFARPLPWDGLVDYVGRTGVVAA
ncbi:two-component system CheB/CheR fusion protein [Tepidimonas ignava]|uniref:Signaling protein n=1 Tax=Tepidimonas ignava TaxID=114249 RepID=A0A4R3LI45_9BURK|nr:EAL domain-containing protein [Tepidimonas ignava]TCS99843.1 two-component system CheB/CheR fusion protein [Tepidimonas ignava]TSE23228.1 putative signaling protein [Tepidimonas ignava]